ncbi:MAG: hypothetical protein ACMUEM_00630 [Flavobacteriales bacterium AspAUS03]
MILDLINVDFYQIKPNTTEEDLVKLENNHLYRIVGKPTPFDVLYNLIASPLFIEIYILQPTYVFDLEFVL